MTIELGRYGAWRRVLEISPAMAAEIEEIGYPAIWVGGSPPGDLQAIEDILDATERVPVVTGIVNMWREDAKTVADSYHRIAQRHPGRFLLGVGIGHPEATREYQKPLDKIVEYLDQLDESNVPADAIVLAALGPKVLRISAERTAGAHPYLSTHRHTKMAREILGAGPLLAPEHTVIVGGDAREAEEQARKWVSRYLQLVNYRNNLRWEGWSDEDIDHGGSDRLLDALVLRGDVESIAAGLRQHVEAGADHVGVQPLGDDPIPQFRELAEVLFD